MFFSGNLWFYSWRSGDARESYGSSLSYTDMQDLTLLKELDQPNEHLASVWALMPPLSPKPGPTLPNLPQSQFEANKDGKGTRFARFIAESQEVLKGSSRIDKVEKISGEIIRSKLWQPGIVLTSWNHSCTQWEGVWSEYDNIVQWNGEFLSQISPHGLIERMNTNGWWISTSFWEWKFVALSWLR